MIVAEETLTWFVFAAYVIMLVVMYMYGFSDGKKAATKLFEKIKQ